VKISIILPVLNEEENLVALNSEITDVLQNLSEQKAA